MYLRVVDLFRTILRRLESGRMYYYMTMNGVKLSKLERIWVDSRVIRSIGYDPTTQVLEVETRGRTYLALEQYTGPAPEMAMAFVSAPSKAAFYYIHVFGKFPMMPVHRDNGIFGAPPCCQPRCFQEIHSGDHHCDCAQAQTWNQAPQRGTRLGWF